MPKLDTDTLQTASLPAILEHLLDAHKPAHVEKLQRYYEGNHDILHRQMLDSAKPNNKLVNNLASYITDTVTGYFMGKPVSYSADDTAYLEALQDIFELNDEQDHNAELAKSQSITGCAYELLYLDEDANTRFVELERPDVIYVTTNDVSGEPLLAVRLYSVDTLGGGAQQFAEVYTATEIVTYERAKEGDQQVLRETDRREHFFGSVPIIEYPNNKELLGEFEGVMSLIDAYNIAQSDTANDNEYFTDAYLKLVGFDFKSEDIAAMKENRVIALPDREGDVDWLVKDINDTAVENYKDRLRRDIHALSKTPNLTDEEFAGNLSGVAISYKLWGLEQTAATKERKFKRSLQRRIELITEILNKPRDGSAQYDWRDIDITFSRNLPQNLVELADVAQKLKGIVSDQTLLAQLPFVEDVQAELDRIEEQNGLVDLDLVEPAEAVGEELDEPRT